MFNGTVDLTFEEGAMVHSGRLELVGESAPRARIRRFGATGQPTTWIVDSDLRVGFGSYTELTIDDGAHLYSDFTTISNASGSAAFVTMNVAESLYATSAWVNSGDVFVGGNEFNGAGQAGLELRRNSRVDIGGTLTIWDPGYFYAIRSVLTADRIDNTHGGEFTMQVDAVTNGAFLAAADINQDGAVDLLDVGPLVGLLTGS